MFNQENTWCIIIKNYGLKKLFISVTVGVQFLRFDYNHISEKAP